MAISEKRCNLNVFSAMSNILANCGTYGGFVAIISRSDPVLGRNISGYPDSLRVYSDIIAPVSILTF